MQETLQISPNGRYLQRVDSKPFFYLADTAWELFHRLTREEAEVYLADRAQKGFTVVQAVALAELDGLRIPAVANGELPLFDQDPTHPNARFFEHVDWVLDRAEAHGLVTGFLPTWGDKWNKRHGIGPEIFTPENARVYGEWIGRRYRDRDLVWILGGDRAVETDTHRVIIRAMAEGLAAGDGGTHLKSFHPIGPMTSTQFWPDEPWLDFHMLQSGHKAKYHLNHVKIEADYALDPVKPCMDGEPCYEGMPMMDDAFEPIAGVFFGEIDVRRRLYWALFAGAHGHTYGAGSIWQMWDKGRPALFRPPMTWREALQLPGAAQMQHAKNLLLAMPTYFERIPDQKLIVGDAGERDAHMQATRDAEGRWALVYMPGGATVTLDGSRLKMDKMRARWFDPAQGRFGECFEIPESTRPTFTAPDDTIDKVLVLQP